MRRAAARSSAVDGAFDLPPSGVTPARSCIDRFPVSPHSSSGSWSPEGRPAMRAELDVTQRPSAAKVSSPMCAAERSAQPVCAEARRARFVPSSSWTRSTKSEDRRRAIAKLLPAPAPHRRRDGPGMQSPRPIPT